MANLAAMKELAKAPENKICADCDAQDPDWCSINLGLFICIKCAGVHRNLGVEYSKVRSIDLDTDCWDDPLVAFMKSVGNVKGRKIYEENAPVYYIRPSETEDPTVRENWIRAKYVRKEFVGQDEQDEEKLNPGITRMPQRSLEGFLMKANQKGQWQKRWFVLHGQFLYYFKDPDDSYPAGEVDCREVKIRIPAESAEGKKMFQFDLETPNRRYPLGAEQAEEMFKWIHAIRRSSLYFNKHESPKKTFEELKNATPELKVTFKDLTKPVKVGVLRKQGGAWKSWNVRYFVLTNNALYYFKQPQPADTDVPEGGITLQEVVDVASAEDKTKRKLCFCAMTHGRMYYFVANTNTEMLEWISALRETILACLRPRKVNFADPNLPILPESTGESKKNHRTPVAPPEYV